VGNARIDARVVHGSLRFPDLDVGGPAAMTECVLLALEGAPVEAADGQMSFYAAVTDDCVKCCGGCVRIVKKFPDAGCIID